MKKMDMQATQQANGGSVRCNYCGWTTWGLGSMRTHQRNFHSGRSYNYDWYTFGPYNCYTHAWQHRGYRGHNC